jgi:hypothetical protein
LGASDEKPHKDDEVGSLNLKCHKLHLDLTLIPNQSYAKMHWLCFGYAYAYSYYAYLGISIHECPDLDEHWLLHDHFMPDMYKYEYLKKTKLWI